MHNKKRLRLNRLGQACQCKFMRRYTATELLPCLGKVGLVLLTVLLVFFLNMGLIISFSYALNGLSYNMSTGCLFTSATPCNETLTFYAHGQIGHLVGLSTILSVIQLFLLLVWLAVATLIINYCRERYVEYTLSVVNDMPVVPTSMDNFDPSDENTDSL